MQFYELHCLLFVVNKTRIDPKSECWLQSLKTICPISVTAILKAIFFFPFLCLELFLYLNSRGTRLKVSFSCKIILQKLMGFKYMKYWSNACSFPIVFSQYLSSPAKHSFLHTQILVFSLNPLFFPSWPLSESLAVWLAPLSYLCHVAVYLVLHWPRLQYPSSGLLSKGSSHFSSQSSFFQFFILSQSGCNCLVPLYLHAF